MKTEEQIRAQRDWFWVNAEAAEEEAEKTADPRYAQIASEFAVVVGTLDWILEETVIEGEVVSEVVE